VYIGQFQQTNLKTPSEKTHVQARNSLEVPSLDAVRIFLPQYGLHHTRATCPATCRDLMAMGKLHEVSVTK
jgi:hypothetical protein